VVDPDAGGVPDGDAVVAGDEADFEVAEDHVGDVLEVEAAAGDLRGGSDAEDGLVGADLDSRGEGDVALDEDDLWRVAGDGLLEISGVVDCYGCAALSAGGGTQRVVSREAFNTPCCKAVEGKSADKRLRDGRNEKESV